MIDTNNIELEPERQLILQQKYELNVSLGKPPYYQVSIHSRNELLWIIKERGWRGDIDNYQRDDLRAKGIFIDRIDLRDTNLSDIDLTNEPFIGADFSGANLLRANLEGVILQDSNLTNTQLRMANLKMANLRYCILVGAHCRGASFQRADLSFANISDARFSQADFSDADLHGIQMNASTILYETKLSMGTCFGDVIWNEALLTSIDWSHIPRLGDEKFLKAKVNGRLSDRYRKVARAYNGLANALKEQGLVIPASRFRLRKQRLEKRAQLVEWKLGAWLFSSLLDLISGYGEQPGRAFSAYIATISIFASIFWWITNHIQTDSKPLQWYEALVLSLSSFHGRGFFPTTINLGDPLAIIAGIEAVIGLFIELIFIATFSRRFLGG